MKRIGLLAAFVGLLCSGCCLMDWTRARPRILPVEKARDIVASKTAGTATLLAKESGPRS